jgi:glutathione S-transferase
MSLTLYFHPLSSFCQKVLVALYENDTRFAPHMVDLMDEKAAEELRKIWPIGKFPVLRDESRNRIVPDKRDHRVSRPPLSRPLASHSG